MHNDYAQYSIGSNWFLDTRLSTGLFCGGRKIGSDNALKRTFCKFQWHKALLRLIQ